MFKTAFNFNVLLCVRVVEILHEGTWQRNGMEMSAGALLTTASSVGPDQMGLRRVDGHQHGIRGRGHLRELRWLQPGLHGVRTVPVVVVDTPVAGDIRPTGEFT